MLSSTANLPLDANRDPAYNLIHGARYVLLQASALVSGDFS